MSSNKKTLIDGDFQVGSDHFKVDTVNNYVGFNNATPQNKIDVQVGTRTGTHSTGKPLYVTGVTSTSGAEFVSDDGTAGIGIGSSNIFTTETNQNITIAPDGTGAVGIKTDTPNPSGETFDLWVQGDTKITGNVTVGTIIGDGSGLTNIISSQWDSSSEDIYFLNNSGSGSGRVAIGTSTPVSLLTLEGTSGGAPPTTGQEGTSNALVRVRDDNNVTLDIGTSSGTSWLQSSDATAMGTNYAISINPNGGNVGVGTISPNVPLEVNKSAGGEIVRLTTSTGTLYAGADADPPWFGTSSDDHLRLMTNGTEKVRIESGGNVGIGITSPGFSLDVDGDINFTGNLYENGSLFVNTPWTIETSPDALNYTAGNVGIGTTTAAYTLDVDGDINFTGDLYENGSLFVNTPWTIETSPDALNYTAGNVGIGGVNPSATLEVTGNTHISSNLSVGGTLTLNTITAAALHSLQAVTNVGNVTSNTVQFTNPTTGLVVDSNIVVTGNVTAGYLYGDASNVTAVPAAQITGTLAVANGGTGTTTSTGSGSVVFSDAPKFTGDVTFDTDTLFVDSVNDRVGVGRVSPTATLDIYKEDTTAAGQTVISSITGVFSGSDATGGNINNTGLYINLDSSATGGGTSATNPADEHRVWGIDVDIDVTGDSDDIKGGRFFVRSSMAANGSDQNTNIFGIEAQGQHNGSGPSTNIIGVSARSFKGTSSTGLTDTMVGVSTEYEINAGTCTDAYGVRASFDRNGGAVTNSYLFYGDHIGSTTTITNNYGLYVTGADRHYLEGDVGIGTTIPDHHLHVKGTGGVRIAVESTSGYGGLELGGTSGGLIDFKTPFSDDYDARIIYSGGNLQFTGADVLITGTLSAGTIEASNISGTVGDTSSGVKAVYFENTENDSTHYTDKSGILVFDENFYPDTEYGTGTYDPNATFVGGNGGGLLIKNEDGWGAIFTSQNTRWAKGYWNSLDVSGGVTASSVTASSFTTSGLAVSTFLGVAPGFESEFIYTKGLVNRNETGTGPAAIIFGNGSTTGNDQISLVTAGTTRLYINSAGNVGIGPTNPLEPLDVRAGGIRFGDNLSSEDISAYVNNYGGITVHSTTGNLGYNISTDNSPEGWCWRFVDNTAAGPGNDYFKVFYSSGNYWHKGTNTSDRRMKTNFVSIDGVDALNSIIKLNPLVYNDKYSNGEINDRLKGGFIAQEVIDVIPHLVGYDEDRDQPNENGYATAYSLDYNGVFTYNVKATQEIYKLLLLEQEKVVTLESQLASVLMRLDALEGA